MLPVKFMPLILNSDRSALAPISQQALTALPRSVLAACSAHICTAPLLLLLQELFYEGSGSNAELILNLILAATLVYIPITIAIIGKRLWIKYRSAYSLLPGYACAVTTPGVAASSLLVGASGTACAVRTQSFVKQQPISRAARVYALFVLCSYPAFVLHTLHCTSGAKSHVKQCQ
jgi:hypothetical protein